MPSTEVTKDAFFRRIGPMNVHPRVGDQAGRYHSSSWETPARVVVGRSVSDAHGIEPTRFWLADAT